MDKKEIQRTINHFGKIKCGNAAIKNSKDKARDGV